MSLKTSASESEEKDVNECMFAGKMCLTDCGVENCALMVLVLLMKNMAKSSAVRVDGGGGGICLKEHLRVRRVGNFMMIVCPFSSGDISRERREDRYTLRSAGFFDLCHTLSAALSLERCSRRTSDSQGAEGVVQAGLEDKGQKGWYGLGLEEKGRHCLNKM